MKKWPNKEESQGFQLCELLKYYNSINKEKEFIIEEASREKPDAVIKDSNTGERLGVELTSVYINDRSVPDKHKKEYEGLRENPYQKEKVEEYSKRIIDKIREKVIKAKKHYDKRWPIILSIYINEDETIYLGKQEWDAITKNNKELLDSINPFIEIILWPIRNGGFASIKPS